MAGDGTSHDSVQNSFVLPETGYRPGYVGQAFVLDGIVKPQINSSSGVRFGSSDSSLALYAKPTALGRQQTLLEWNPVIAGGFTLGVTQNGNLKLDLKFGDDTIRTIESPAKLQVGMWSHIAATKTEGAAYLFLNGRQVGEVTLANAPPMLGRVGPYNLGWSAATPSPFAGLLDEVTIWARALSPSEIAALYARRINGPCKTAAAH
jgi:hypothetical protein